MPRLTIAEAPESTSINADARIPAVEPPFNSPDGGNPVYYDASLFAS